ncbi:MAG: hypothetical protein EOO37_00070 [Cytophagaceae bacterium]|nr:MAG: hypothetical protein EOO37_00070 [Cytophagaceae bacterium]
MAGSVVKTISTVAKAAVVPMASFAAGLVPGIGPLLSQGVDILGNALVGGAGGSAEAVAEVAPSPVEYLTRPMDAATLSLGSSPVAQALASATSPEIAVKNGFLGIGDGKPGVAGIGDGKPGVVGIGTGKNKAKKAAEATATAQGKSTAEVKAAGQQAAAKVNEDGTPTSSVSPIAIGVGILLALFAL